MNKEEIKKEIEDLIRWSYKASFQNLFKYNSINQSTTLSKVSEEKIDKIINKICK